MFYATAVKSVFVLKRSVAFCRQFLRTVFLKPCDLSFSGGSAVETRGCWGSYASYKCWCSLMYALNAACKTANTQCVHVTSVVGSGREGRLIPTALCDHSFVLLHFTHFPPRRLCAFRKLIETARLSQSFCLGVCACCERAEKKKIVRNLPCLFCFSF